VILRQAQDDTVLIIKTMQKLYNTIALGGTFDRLHIGHKKFINFAAQLGQQLLIGVTAKELTLYKQHARLIQPVEERMAAMEIFCKQQDINASVVEIADDYGPTTDDKTIDAIAVTEVTIKGANTINAKRKEVSLPKLPIHICGLLKDQYGGVISSSRVRSGDISRNGNVYRDILLKTITLADTAREFLTQQHGDIVNQPKQEGIICVVGDASLERFINNHWQYNLGVYDGKTRRQQYESAVLEAINPDDTIANNPGEITQELSKSIIDSIPTISKKVEPKHIKIEGEEDLTSPVLVLTLPLGSVIYYGQPTKGMVELLVTEQLKQETYNILAQ
jgi:pantetheine-phosphate adenylyltransferase